jgi:hypothetical protein
VPAKIITHAALALLALAVAAAPAGAESISSGKTSFKLERHLYEQLRANDVQVRQLKPGKAAGRVVTLPISSGGLEPTYGSGYLFYEGGFRLQADKHQVVLKRFVLNTTEQWLRGKVGGRTLTIAKLPERDVSRDGFDVAVAGELRLTGRAAQLLNRRLAIRGVFEAGRPLAATSTLYHPFSLGVIGGTIALAFDAGFLAKLASLEVAISTAEGGTLAGSPPQVLSLPISLGSISPDLMRGVLISEGGFALSQEGEPPRWARFIAISVSPESRLLDAAINLPTGTMSALATVDFTGVAAQADPATGLIAAQGATATLNPSVAAALNEIFAAPKGKSGVFVGGEALAAVSFAAQTR